MTEEQWMPVVGYEGLYEVSDAGRVRSVDRISSDGSRRKGKILKPVASQRLQVTLSRASVRKQCEIHRLVLEAFGGPAPKGKIACHRDDNHENNSLSNLYWGSYSENWADSVVNGGRPSGRRDSALTEVDVLSIRARCGTGETQRSVAADFGLDQSAVSLIVNRKVWANVYE